MIRIGSEFIFWSVAFFIVMLIFDGFDIALQSTIFFFGMIYYTYNIAFVYLRLKKVCFNFEQAASKKEWLWFLLTNIIIWSLFLVSLPERGVVMVEIIPHGLLIILLIYDIIKTLLKKMFG